jgi:hypothetical protein
MESTSQFQKNLLFTEEEEMRIDLMVKQMKRVMEIAKYNEIPLHLKYHPNSLLDDEQFELWKGTVSTYLQARSVTKTNDNIVMYSEDENYYLLICQHLDNAYKLSEYQDWDGLRWIGKISTLYRYIALEKQSVTRILGGLNVLGTKDELAFEYGFRVVYGLDLEEPYMYRADIKGDVDPQKISLMTNASEESLQQVAIAHYHQGMSRPFPAMSLTQSAFVATAYKFGSEVKGKRAGKPHIIHIVYPTSEMITFSGLNDKMKLLREFIVVKGGVQMQQVKFSENINRLAIVQLKKEDTKVFPSEKRQLLGISYNNYKKLRRRSDLIVPDRARMNIDAYRDWLIETYCTREQHQL